MINNRRVYGIFTGLLLVFSAFASVAQTTYEIVVAKDGSGEFTSIQEAIHATKAFPDKRITIHVRNGVYEEKVEIYAWNTRLTIRGESREGTIIRFADHFDKVGLGRNSTFHTATLRVRANDFRLENLTVENVAGPVGQAIALSVEADRCVISNCRITGHQDTLYVAGEGNRMLFRNCYIEGTTDFIFGEATAVFKNCQIVAKADSYITAASTPEEISFGLVFMDCTVEGTSSAEKVYLGRPWRPFARTVFLNTEMSEVICPEGWHNWNKPEVEKTAFYAEYQCSGPGFKPGKRVEWAHILTAREAEEYTLESIFRAAEKTADTWYQTEAND